jgi:repressor LexA
MREIGKRFEIASTNGVNDHLRAIERKGWIQKGKGKASRAIRVLTPDGSCAACGRGGKGDA